MNFDDDWEKVIGSDESNTSILVETIHSNQKKKKNNTIT